MAVKKVTKATSKAASVKRPGKAEAKHIGTINAAATGTTASKSGLKNNIDDAFLRR